MATRSLITEIIIALIVLGVRFMNQENFSDEQTEITNQIAHLRADVETGVLLVLALPVIGMLVWVGVRLLWAKLTTRHCARTSSIRSSRKAPSRPAAR